MDSKNSNNYFFMYRKLLNSFNEFLTDKVSKYALSPNEIVVLTTLKETSKASEIAMIANVSKALISRSVKLLKSKGFIEIRVDDKDKREQTLSLTEEGEKLAADIEIYKAEFFERAFYGFTEDEANVLKLLLQIMCKNLNA